MPALHVSPTTVASGLQPDTCPHDLLDVEVADGAKTGRWQCLHCGLSADKRTWRLAAAARN